MAAKVRKADVKRLVGKPIFALHKDGKVFYGKLLKLSGNRLILAPVKTRKASTSAIIPLVLFDLLAVGTAPYGYGGFGPGVPFGGGNPYGFYPGAYGGGPFF